LNCITGNAGIGVTLLPDIFGKVKAIIRLTKNEKNDEFYTQLSDIEMEQRLGLIMQKIESFLQTIVFG
jgi:hypothetical protein